MDGFDLKVMRLRAGMTQWRAAQAIQIAPQELCHIERGRRHLDLGIQKALVGLYRMRIAEEDIASKSEAGGSDTRVDVAS